MDLIRDKLTQEIVSLADLCLAALEKRGAVINGKSATELRERLRRAGAGATRAGYESVRSRPWATPPDQVRAGSAPKR